MTILSALIFVVRFHNAAAARYEETNELTKSEKAFAEEHAQEVLKKTLELEDLFDGQKTFDACYDEVTRELHNKYLSGLQEMWAMADDPQMLQEEFIIRQMNILYGWEEIDVRQTLVELAESE